MVSIKVKINGLSYGDCCCCKMSDETLNSLRNWKTRKVAQEKQRRMKRHS